MQGNEVDGAEVIVAMQRMGYKRCGPRLFRASWTAEDVYNLVSLSTFSYAGPAAFVTPKFALKCHAAERFSMDCYRDFRSAIWPSSTLDAPQGRWDTTMSFELAATISDLSGNSVWPMTLRDYSQSVFVDHLVADVAKYILPMSKSILGLPDAYRVLVSDVEVARWFRCNGAIRAGIIAHVGYHLELPVDAISLNLSIRKEEIERSVRPWSADRYMGLIFSKLGIKP